ncbi:MAG: methyltransferase domain-containing protein [Thermoplasmata archaeon]
MDATKNVWTRVRERYGKAAKEDGCCEAACCESFYSAEERERVPSESTLSFGSGNPVRHAGLREGEVVVDLGSGAGIDAFLAASRIGPQGRAIGVDMTPEMVERARRAAARGRTTNVEFHLAMIEELPLEDGTADVVLSNCVINLSPDKAAVFREAFRVLRPGGRLVISDIVQERPLGPMEDDCGCVATAMVRADYLDTIRAAGFGDVQILEDRPWLQGPQGVDASSITLRAVKPREEMRK